MNELPQDAARLRVILQHLDKQVTDNETVGIYLRLQRDAVRAALAQTEGQPPAPPQPQQKQRPPAALPTFTSGRRDRQSTGFSVEQQPRAMGPEPVRIHTDDCPHAGVSHPISAHDARAALLDPNVRPCPFCRPDSELGMDLD